MVTRASDRSTPRRHHPRRPSCLSRPGCRCAGLGGGVESLEPRTLLAVAPAGTEFRVNTTTEHSQAIPSIGMNANGDFVVAWESWDGTGIYAQRYGAAGQPLGGEFRASTAGGRPAV